MKNKVPKGTDPIELADRMKRAAFRESIKRLRRLGKLTPH